jgi:hypothetical protein
VVVADTTTVQAVPVVVEHLEVVGQQILVAVAVGIYQEQLLAVLALLFLI